MRPPDRVCMYCILFPCSRLGVSVSGFFITVSFVLQTHLFHSHSHARTHSATHGAEPPLARCRSRVHLGSRQSSSSARLSVGKTQR